MIGKKTGAMVLGVAMALGSLSGCSSDANVANENITKGAENFEIPRRIVFVNGITDKYLLEITGYCNIDHDQNKRQLAVVCKSKDGFKKSFLGLSDNVTYFAEQLSSADVSTDHYRVVFKPSVIIPSIDIR